MAGADKDEKKGQDKINAEMLDAAAKMVKKAVKEEADMLLGVPKEIEKIRLKLEEIKNFLTDADKRNITDPNMQTLVTEHRSAMQDATRIIDSSKLKVMDGGPSRDMGCFDTLLFCLRNPLHTHRIGRRIKNLNKKLSDMKARGEFLNFDMIKAIEPHHQVNKIEPETAWSLLKKQATPEGEQPKTPTAASRVQELDVEVVTEKQGAAALKDQFHGQKGELEVLKKKVEESEEARQKHAEEIENLKKQAEETNALLGRLVTLNKD